jgi:hypothetical protein
MVAFARKTKVSLLSQWINFAETSLKFFNFSGRGCGSNK